ALAVPPQQLVRVALADDLHHATRRQSAELAEVRLGHDRAPGGELLPDQLREQLHRRVPEADRPLAVAGAERVEERLLDLVLREQRPPELSSDRARERRLATRRRTCHDDERHRDSNVKGVVPFTKTVASLRGRSPPELWSDRARERRLATRRRTCHDDER